MTKEQFYLHTLADHWQEMGHPYAADLLRHHANGPGPHEIQELPGFPDPSPLHQQVAQTGRPGVRRFTSLIGHGKSKVVLYGPGQPHNRLVASLVLPHGVAGHVLGKLADEGAIGADLAHEHMTQHFSGLIEDAGPPQLNTAKLEAPEQDWRPDEAIPEDYYSYSRKRKYAAVADGDKARVFLRMLAGHWRDLGHPTGADVALHLANQAEPFVSEHPNGVYDETLANWLHANKTRPAVRVGRISDLGTRLAFYVPGNDDRSIRRLPFLVLPHHQAFALMTKLAKEKFQGAKTAANQIMYNGTNPDGKKLLRRDGGEHNLPPLDVDPGVGELDWRPNEVMPEDYYSYSRRRLARAKARHDGRRATRKLARRVGARKYSHEAFAAAIRRKPNDPVVRGAYADYLEERDAHADPETLAALRGPHRVWMGHATDRDGRQIVFARPLPKITMAMIRANNKAIGNHWFDRGSMRFFNTRLERRVHTGPGGTFFVTSDQFSPSRPRRWSVRQANPDGSIGTVGNFMTHAYPEDAHEEAAEMAAQTPPGLTRMGRPYRAPAGVPKGARPILDRLTLARGKVLRVPIHAVLPDRENLDVAADSLHRGNRSEDTRPLEVYRVGRRFVLADGHHRLLQAILAGDDTVRVSPRETDRPPGTKYTVRLDPKADLYGLPESLPRNGWLLKRLKLGRPYRAPAGGTVVRGVFYVGGSLLPDLTGAFATGRTPAKPAAPAKPRKINWAAALRRWTGRPRNR